MAVRVGESLNIFCATKYARNAPYAYFMRVRNFACEFISSHIVAVMDDVHRVCGIYNCTVYVLYRACHFISTSHFWESAEELNARLLIYSSWHSQPSGLWNHESGYFELPKP